MKPHVKIRKFLGHILECLQRYTNKFKISTLSQNQKTLKVLTPVNLAWSRITNKPWNNWQHLIPSMNAKAMKKMRKVGAKSKDFIGETMIC